MSYTIVTDSTCNLPERLIEELGLEIIPMLFFVNGEEHVGYRKGEVADLGKFYAMMREGAQITTSTPNMAHAKETFASILERGEDVLYLGFSSALSSTFDNVELIASELREQFPERTFRCVGTLAAAQGQGLLVKYAVDQKRAGKTLDEVADWVEENRKHLCHWFTVDDLMYLYRGGRVSRTSAFAANMLSIKPVLHVDDEGRLIPVDKMRGRKKSIQKLLEHMEETAIEPVSEQTVYIGHSDCLEEAQHLKDMVQERFGVTDFLIHDLDPVIGAHTGPGTLCLFFWGEKR